MILPAPSLNAPAPSLSAPAKQTWFFAVPICLKRPALHVSTELKQRVDSEMHIFKKKEERERHFAVT